MSSPIAQLVEQMTVNHWVAGSSPAWGASRISQLGSFYLLLIPPKLNLGAKQAHSITSLLSTPLWNFHYDPDIYSIKVVIKIRVWKLYEILAQLDAVLWKTFLAQNMCLSGLRIISAYRANTCFWIDNAWSIPLSVQFLRQIHSLINQNIRIQFSCQERQLAD